MNEQDRTWYNEWTREFYERRTSKEWQNNFAAEWYESMDRYREERAREKQKEANRKARERFEGDWGFRNGIGPWGSAVFDSFDPWCDDFDIPFFGGLDPGDYDFI